MKTNGKKGELWQINDINKDGEILGKWHLPVCGSRCDVIWQLQDINKIFWQSGHVVNCRMCVNFQMRFWICHVTTFQISSINSCFFFVNHLSIFQSLDSILDFLKTVFQLPFLLCHVTVFTIFWLIYQHIFIESFSFLWH